MGSFFSKPPETDWYGPILSYEFFCDALTKWVGEPVRYGHCIYLDDLSTSFISEVVQWKVCIIFEGEERQTYAELMLKYFPRNKTRAHNFRSAEFFKNEINFYDKVLPELLGFQNSKEISGSFDNCVKLCFTHLDGEYDMICLKDARTDGYNAKEIIDIEHGKLILKTLARFHALSYALKTENPEKYKTLTNDITETYYSNKFWSWYKKLWSHICSVAITAIEAEHTDSIYVKKIKEFAVPKRFKDLIKAINNDNSVILHGDCKINNYLFKYDSEKPVDIKMVDFQQVRCGNPVLDISSLFYSNSVLLTDYDALLKYYHGNLVMTIKDLGGDPDVYTFDILMEDMKKYSYFGLAFSLEAVCTKLTSNDITEKVCQWIWEVDQDKYKKVDIADAYHIKNLEKEERLSLANSIVHCVDHGYI